MSTWGRFPLEAQLRVGMVLAQIGFYCSTYLFCLLITASVFRFKIYEIGATINSTAITFADDGEIN